MAGRRLSAADVPTPGPWLVRGEAEPGASAVALMRGVPPAANDRPGGWPYFIRRDVPIEPGGSSQHIASGIQRLADARLIAAAPDLAATLLHVMTTPDLMRSGLDTRTQEAVTSAWHLLVRVAPHLEIGP
ncbi:hypothetical protein [Methylobacterium iners]|uniref:TetR family transcriptional regulator n=1 Tax=Methylobacterium iners TaxID=418707 RepID=A0ABQ4S388_9HYPH|nr:hypothetical protein [Methylobacterium iners]GJD96237.1 hypothetical protein OCOJLMKI_3457 [Methylobacterium iners]